MKFIFILAAVVTATQGVQFTFVNNHPDTIWVGSLANPGHDQINGGGWELASGAQETFDAPDASWAGRFWARTGCNFDENGNGHCETGDCGNVLQCSGAGGAPPVTLAEIKLNGDQGLDFYDVSNVDGFNIPVSFKPTDQSGGGDQYRCTEVACPANINDICPEELKLKSDNGATVGCKSACLAFNTDEYCCKGDHGTPQTCKSTDWPVDYPKKFKDACPDAYSYAYDDHKSTFTCQNTGYTITFS